MKSFGPLMIEKFFIAYDPIVVANQVKRRTLCVEDAPLVAFSCQSHVHVHGVRLGMLFSVGG